MLEKKDFKYKPIDESTDDAFILFVHEMAALQQQILSLQKCTCQCRQVENPWAMDHPVADQDHLPARSSHYHKLTLGQTKQFSLVAIPVMRNRQPEHFTLLIQLNSSNVNSKDIILTFIFKIFCKALQFAVGGQKVLSTLTFIRIITHAMQTSFMQHKSKLIS